MQRRQFIKGSVGLGALAVTGASGPVSTPSLAQTGTARKNVPSGKKRIMIGAFAHETNTFNPFITDVNVFRSSARFGVKGVSVLLNSRPIGPSDMSRPNALGIYPEKYRMTVCKGGFAFRTTYRPDTYSYILADTPGFTSTGIKKWTYTKIKRPIYPLDDI